MPEGGRAARSGCASDAYFSLFLRFNHEDGDAGRIEPHHSRMQFGSHHEGDLLREQALLFRDQTLDTVLEKDGRLRHHYVALVSRPRSTTSPAIDVVSTGDRITTRETLELSASVLELVLVTAACTEAIVEFNIRTFGDFRKHAAGVLQLADRLSGLDSVGIIATSSSSHTSLPMPSDDDPAPTLEAILLVGGGIVASCPIAALEAQAAQSSLEPLGHRCRVAYDRLRAFVRRNDPGNDPSWRVIGRVFSQGHISLADAAAAMQVNVADALVRLEELGYSRSADAIQLTSEQREARYAAMRADRVDRGGKPVESNDDLVARNVIASQRIEEVDARFSLRRPVR